MERASAERTGAPAATESAPPPDLPAIRERVLAGLKLGRQAPGYKAAAKALSEFMRELDLPTGTGHLKPETQEEGL